MRHGGRLSFFLVLFFLATQFVSIFGTMSVLASPETVGNYEDISPDHLIPLDPFLAGGGHPCFRAPNNHANNASALNLMRWLPVFIMQSVALWFTAPALVRRIRPYVLARYTPPLWLLHRVLLI